MFKDVDGKPLAIQVWHGTQNTDQATTLPPACKKGGLACRSQGCSTMSRSTRSTGSSCRSVVASRGLERAPL